MKVIRRLSKRGNSFHVSLPPQLIDHLRWRITDGIIVELTEDDDVRLRRVKPADLGATPMPPMNLDLSALVTK
jgi:antitoxin component of MazEF toxin-antitoxin module